MKIISAIFIFTHLTALVACIWAAFAKIKCPKCGSEGMEENGYGIFCENGHKIVKF